MIPMEFLALLKKNKVSPYKFAIDSGICLTSILMICKGDIPPTKEVLQALREYIPKKSEYM